MIRVKISKFKIDTSQSIKSLMFVIKTEIKLVDGMNAVY